MMLDEHYSRLLARTPTMPAAEQQALTERYARSRDRRDAERLVLGNLRLVVKLAREIGGRYPGDLMDLVQELLVGSGRRLTVLGLAGLLVLHLFLGLL